MTFGFSGTKKLYSSPGSVRRDDYHKNSGIHTALKTDWRSIGKSVREFYNYTCCGCAKPTGKTGGDVHHVIPLSKGGVTALRNLILLCDDCHSLRHRHLRNPR